MPIGQNSREQRFHHFILADNDLCDIGFQIRQPVLPPLNCLPTSYLQRASYAQFNGLFQNLLRQFCRPPAARTALPPPRSRWRMDARHRIQIRQTRRWSARRYHWKSARIPSSHKPGNQRFAPAWRFPPPPWYTYARAMVAAVLEYITRPYGGSCVRKTVEPEGVMTSAISLGEGITPSLATLAAISAIWSGVTKVLPCPTPVQAKSPTVGICVSMLES